MKVHTDFEQQSEEWFALKLGKISASSFHKLLGTPAARNRYLCQKASERHTGKRSDSSGYSNYHMQRGNLYEEAAREAYKEETFYEVQKVGLITLNDDVVCSPDGLVNGDGLIEIKIHDSDIYFENVEFLDEKGKDIIMKLYKLYYTQTQVNLYISGRSWCDYVLYNPTHAAVGTGIHICRIEKDMVYMDTIKLAIEEAVKEINQKAINFKKIFDKKKK